MARSIGLIGVPTSAGAFAPGQEQAPRALRQAGLLKLLREQGVDVRDHGDREAWRWRPDRDNRRAQNLGKVVEIVRDTAQRVHDAHDAGQFTLVLGGDCTVGIGTVAGHASHHERLGLVYFDAHADLNVPDSVPEGALDWMGVAHMLDEPGSERELATVGPRVPLLEPDRVLLFGWDEAQSTPSERASIERRRVAVIPAERVGDDPERAAAAALEELCARCDRVLVHFDVDVIDFTDAPLSENPGRNEGLSYDSTLAALERLLASPKIAGLTVTELNPDHAEDARAIENLAAALAHGLAGSVAL